mmetsp:Transcript_68706/g.212423  ORF Transcript_68706/g.212423 Transcript_68706/m.212423 type:complete len:371 (-) Transcript_68706:77-1189(-)|eukprot:CAMPEP_0204583068 /NCGR_PEP_ID=MMETSP0661-20131031/45568_1 /ASSEMBLY_ACC=CAM_ASM_000606 /TAXON_ID=109239 /ORGANISM="Alexandrium margalefi, Strain AMGDE01CS-322" /LENGTH=370 /DNA_ID=CAMNT_0051592397 /DNA_START=33 /DNA_END=1145 /DNA_ORIENTATION=+
MAKAARSYKHMMSDSSADSAPTAEDLEVATRNEEERVWEEFQDQAAPNFFHEIDIAKDGGFAEVEALWDSSRWFIALIAVFFLISNLYYMIWIDISIIYSNTEVHINLFSQVIIRKLTAIYKGMRGLDQVRHIPADRYVAFAELMLTVFMLLKLLRCIFTATFNKNPMKRWFATEKAWWTVLPDLTTYSAMRLLHYVSPQVLGADLLTQLSISAPGQSLLFIVSRLACFVIGFDAFILKCHESKQFIESERLRISDIWVGLIFLKQVLGIVQLYVVVRERLFVFIFAGEDGIMQPVENAKKKVWNAMVAREIFRKLSTAKAVAVMLSFSDMDFQRLVFNETTDKCTTPRRLPSHRAGSSSDDSEGSASEV